MGAEGAWVPAVIGLVVSAAGTGMSMYSQSQQAKTTERMAAYNAAVERNNADVQNRLALYQSQVNARAAEAEAQARMINATTIQNQATGVEAQSRERTRRMREEQERMLSLQRAKYAQAGVVNEGSPLVVLADTARLAEMNIQDAAYEGDLQRASLYREAEMERYQAGYSLLDAAQSTYRGAVAETSRRIAYRQADITRLTGAAEASRLRAGATATLISGVGSATSQAGDIYTKSISTPYTASSPGGPFNPYAQVRPATRAR